MLSAIYIKNIIENSLNYEPLSDMQFQNLADIFIFKGIFV